MDTNFLLYGAAGYTGQLIARKAVEQGMRPLLAGRTANKLEPIAVAFNLDYRVFSLDNPAAIDTALAVVRRVLAGEAPAGFQTPAQVYGADFVLGIKSVKREETQ